MKFKLPSQKRLHELFVESSPGVLQWRLKVRGRRGDIAGSKALRGSRGTFYWRIGIGYVDYPRSRIIYKMYHGKDPLGVIDHINKNPLDDRIDNLRDVTVGQNSRNVGRGDGKTYFVTKTQKRSGGRSNNFLVNFSIACHSIEERDTVAHHLNSLCTPYIDQLYYKWLHEGEKPIEKPIEKLTVDDLDDLLEGLP